MRMTYYLIDTDAGDEDIVVPLEARTLDEAIAEAAAHPDLYAQVVDIYQVGRPDPVAVHVEVEA